MIPGQRAGDVISLFMLVRTSYTFRHRSAEVGFGILPIFIEPEWRVRCQILRYGVILDVISILKTTSTLIAKHHFWHLQNLLGFDSHTYHILSCEDLEMCCHGMSTVCLSFFVISVMYSNIPLLGRVRCKGYFTGFRIFCRRCTAERA